LFQRDVPDDRFISLSSETNMAKHAAVFAFFLLLVLGGAHASTLIGNPTFKAAPAASPAANSLSILASAIVLFGCSSGSTTVTVGYDIANSAVALPTGSWCSMRVEDLEIAGAYALPGGAGSLDLALGDRLLALPALTGEEVDLVVDVSALVVGSPAPLRAGEVLDASDAGAQAAAAAIELFVVIPQ
jgi:hypothetical protein